MMGHSSDIVRSSNFHVLKVAFYLCVSDKHKKLLQQFQQHSAQLSSQGISDQELSIALESLVHFASNFKLNCWHNIVSQSSIIEAVSSLMFETTNPNIRNMCGTVLYILQQRGTETNEIVDWKMLVQPLVSLLFNPHILISELGKQIILEKISKKPEILHSLIEIGLFEHALEEINSLIPSSQNLLLEAKDIIPLQVLGNILEVVLMTIKQGILCERKISKLRIAIEKLMQDLKTQQIESIFKEILHFAEQITKIRTDQELQLDLEEKLQDYERKQKEDQDLIRIAEQRVKIAEENQRIAQEKLQESQDFKIIAEEKAKLAQYRSQISEDNKRIAEDRIKVAEINSIFAEERARIAELKLKDMQKDLDAVQQRESTYLQMLKQLQSKDNEKQRLWNEFNQYLPQSEDINFVHQLTSTPQNSSPQQIFATQKLLNKVVLSKEDLIKIIDIIEGNIEQVDAAVQTI
ncbi:MAG: hypothetical protein EZS28_020478 [Streblomastix strix]|uniref:Uncharacterized protein n=1 Tax=Streblomastix strix TaxID=222440 RepID=A0A5J4VNS0_9EUKA|nr:MAG: hypothetical protein EZS28_020478 [Streblomastix strix]